MNIPRKGPVEPDHQWNYIPADDKPDDSARPIDSVAETAARLAAQREHEKKHPATTRSFTDILAEVSRERAAREGGDHA